MSKRRPLSNIRFLRVYLDMSQRELAERLDIDQNHLSKIETGRIRPMRRTLEKFARYFSRRLKYSIDPESLRGHTVHETVMAQFKPLKKRRRPAAKK